jgi:invasion protein IalB
MKILVAALLCQSLLVSVDPAKPLAEPPPSAWTLNCKIEEGPCAARQIRSTGSEDGDVTVSMSVSRTDDGGRIEIRSGPLFLPYLLFLVNAPDGVTKSPVVAQSCDEVGCQFIIKLNPETFADLKGATHLGIMVATSEKEGRTVLFNLDGFRDTLERLH